MISRAGLSISLILGSLCATGAAQAFDRSTACAQAQKAVADRCVAAAPATVAPETVVYGILSDHDERYDPQGNPIDRQGNIVATPGRSGADREVFAIDTGVRR